MLRNKCHLHLANVFVTLMIVDIACGTQYWYPRNTVIRRQTLATSTLQPIRALNKSTEIIRAAKLNSGEENLSSEKPELVPVFMGAALIVSVTGLALGMVVQYLRKRNLREASRSLQEQNLPNSSRESNPRLLGNMSLDECTLPSDISSLKDLPYKDTPMGKVYSDLIVYTQNDHAKFSELVPMKNLYEKRSLNPQYLLTQSGQLNDLAESAEAIEKPTAVKENLDEEQSATEGKVQDSLASPGEGPSTSDTNKDN